MELQQLQLEIVISEDTERETQRQSLKVRVQQRRASRTAAAQHMSWARHGSAAAWLCSTSIKCTTP
jgi:hypothetical protein